MWEKGGNGESMKGKQIFQEVLLAFLVVFCFLGCAGDMEPPQEGEAETSAREDGEEESKEAGESQGETTKGDAQLEAVQKRREIPVDFPFYGEEKEHRLVLAAPEEGQNSYELLYYDEDGKILQQIFCGKLTEPVTFSFDGLAYASWCDLEMFSAGSDTGLLFTW